MSEKIDYSKGIYDARQLGTGRMLILGLQHMFAMFGATVLVPLLTGLSVSTTLLCAGLGTLLFHLVTKGKVPAFLGSSFAYLGGFSIVAPMLADADGNLTVANTKMLPYACAGVALSGILYLLVSLLISTFGIRRIMKFFPPVVTGHHHLHWSDLAPPPSPTASPTGCWLLWPWVPLLSATSGARAWSRSCHPDRCAGLLCCGSGHWCSQL